MQRLLVMRGGAIGDMILTLPALGLLRQAFPQAHIDLVGNPRRAVLAHHPRYVDTVIDMEAWPLHSLFSQQPQLAARARSLLARYQLIVSYLPTTDTTFHTNLRQYCPGDILTWTPLPPDNVHATDHLLQPVRHFLPPPYNPIPHVPLTPSAQEAAEHFWHHTGLPNEGVLACHLGSGSARKIWPFTGWQEILRWARQHHIPVLLISGPAEHEKTNGFGTKEIWSRWPCAHNLPLPHLAALLARCQMFLGHDSGTSHLAAAVGTTTLTLFGPTDPASWGPRSYWSTVLRPPVLEPLTLDNLPPIRVIQTLASMYNGTFCFAPSSLGCTILSTADAW